VPRTAARRTRCYAGSGAEHILSQLLVKPGDFVPGNMYFATTRLHQELAGGTFVEVIVGAAHDPRDESPFKGVRRRARHRQFALSKWPGPAGPASRSATVITQLTAALPSESA
jgi:hypothetical protein